jgi:RNA polymerase sigma-70 factor (ECF subfamily)
MCQTAGVRFRSKGVIWEAASGHGASMREPVPLDPARPPADTSPALPAAPPVTTVEIAVRIQQLVTEYMDFVWRSLRRLGIAEADCDDGCQRVWVVLAKKVASIEPDKTRSYLFSVVVRVASEMRRASGRHQHVELDEHLHAPTPLDAEGLLEQKRVRELLDQVLSGLSWDLRTVFVMFELEGLSSPEIADALGVSRGTIASRLRLAREAFRRGVERCQARARASQPLVTFVGQPSKAVS